MFEGHVGMWGYADAERAMHALCQLALAMHPCSAAERWKPRRAGTSEPVAVVASQIAHAQGLCSSSGEEVLILWGLQAIGWQDCWGDVAHA